LSGLNCLGLEQLKPCLLLACIELFYPLVKMSKPASIALSFRKEMFLLFILKKDSHEIR